MFIIYKTDDKRVVAAGPVSKEQPAFGTKDVDYKIVEIANYDHTKQWSFDEANPTELIEIIPEEPLEGPTEEQTEQTE